MSDRVRFDVRGLRELDEAMRKLPVALQEQMMQPALLAGGETLRKGMQRRVPRRSGATSGSIEVTDPKVGPRSGTVKVGSTKRAYVLRFLEFGVKTHAIVAAGLRKGKRASWGKRALASQSFGPKARVKQHPGVRAQHPMQQTVEQDGPAAVRAFGTSLYDALVSFCAHVKKAS